MHKKLVKLQCMKINIPTRGNRQLKRRQKPYYLGPVEVGQIGRGEVLGQVGPEQDVIHIMAQEAVVDVRGHARVVHRKLPQRRLHPVKARRLPDEVDDKVGAAADGRALRWKSPRIKIHRQAYRFSIDF
jgi:hypothetical protein